MNVISQFYPAVNIFIVRAPYEKCIEYFYSIPEHTRRTIKFFAGHICFGIHEAIPLSSTYITMLRNPVERIVSHYYFVLHDKNHPLNSIVKTRNMNLDTYVSSDISPELTNGQTRMLSGRRETDFLQGTEACNNEDLKRAKQHLDEMFSMVGITERFDEGLIALGLLFNWKIPIYRKENITPNRPPLKAIPSREIKIIEKYNSYDLELYYYACKKFDDILYSLGDSFEESLRQYKFKQKAFEKINYLQRYSKSISNKFIKILK